MSDDITFCSNWDCNVVKGCDCNPKNIRHPEIPHSFSDYAGTEYCPKESEDGNERYESIDGVLYDKIDKMLVAYPMGRADECYTVKDGTLEIGSNAFAVASMIETVVLPDSIVRIGERAFSASSVKSLYMCSGVESCDYGPFAETDMAIYFDGSEAEWLSVEFLSDDIWAGTTPVFFGVSYTP